MWLQSDNPLNDIGSGFREAIYGSKETQLIWHDLYTVILIVFALIFLFSSKWFTGLFSRYRQQARAKSREEKKRALLRKLIFGGRDFGEAESELLKRLVTYYSLNSESAGIYATPEQLLHFSKSLFKLMRRLTYDQRGRLVIPELERQLEETVHMNVEHKKALASEWKGIVWQQYRTSPQEESPTGKAARVALNLIRMNKPTG